MNKDKPPHSKAFNIDAINDNQANLFDSKPTNEMSIALQKKLKNYCPFNMMYKTKDTLYFWSNS
jgi:hypothetical protein